MQTRAVALGASLACFAAVPSAHAIITRDDVDDADFRVYPSQYPAVIALLGPGDCLGTLIHPTYVLTVAHCAAEVPVGTALTIGGDTRTVSSVILHPRWQDGGDTFDIAMLRLDAATLQVEPYQLYRGGDEVGQQVELLGAGKHGTGIEGEQGASDDGLLRRATNTVDAVDDHFLRFTFDDPSREEVTDREGVGAAGDSGGPVLLRQGGITYLAGLNAWGGSCDHDVGQYGAADYQTRVSTFADWIDAIIAGRTSDEGPSGGSSFADAECGGCSVGDSHRGNHGGWMVLLVLAAAWRRHRRP